MRVINKKSRELRTPVAFHPGEPLLEEIEERRLKKNRIRKKYRVITRKFERVVQG